ncbi:hypothetical protein A2715_05370 [Candidatus Woesebacteria bacterium RIFCSPHIGHO2_01_FULL_39_32]|uniref:Endonuclease NucS C-terminal domain-containing protein n=1 Tax=Candidatus Woesebacteria bacterium RIFCSPLOWO2_01_FULL_39_25 TaxID=1802521 RepID=A0A1F8BLZ1_9BACT|nr:MAG: hypothetical protein A2715_05370 [Candidatus Woesebacteria bacterium RIFCSPHIGHO2_01_FULL_39_32]OGM38552.1 MAG: hypothetical protein A3F01_04325 [Candidatus Woesebacteria bacterium RIFCSPHIGHO2_12_FULL_38_11]OGM64980.1 MAG: hypothetical protein A2893_04980 [Candidatus Woesebacteria bacterium RIFCSPLOWO2_01_FULL_39_25]
MSSVIEKVIKEKAVNDPWWQGTSEQQVIGKYGQLFQPKNLDKLTKEDFKSFLLIKNNLHWEGIHRQGNIITSDMNALKRFLKHVLDEKLTLEKRLNTEFIENGGYWVKGIGRAIITAILMVVYPEKYGIWNTKSEAALKKLNLFPSFQRNYKFGDKFKKINEVLLELSNMHNISLWQLDGVLGDIAGASPFAGKVDENEEQIEEELKELGIEDPVVFGMEKHLEDFLIANWDKTIFGKKYDLIYGEGNELTSQQYPTDIGFIDILAKSKDDKEYLVIELKKGRSSDAVVGQTLRYISWVKRNLAEERKVKGTVVVLDAEEKLKYSLYDQKDISLFTYKVSFDLKKENF